MTDAPERIWTTGNGETGSWNATEGRMKLHMPDCWQTEYIRADLEATASPSIATPLDDPRVKALVEALKEAERMLKHYGSRDAGGMAQIRAALEAIASPSISALEENK